MSDYEPHALTADDLRDPAWREALEAALESWLPSHTTDPGRVDSYSDLLDRLEGSIEVGGVWYELDLGGSLTSPAYRGLLALARKIARQLAEGE